MTEAVAAAVRVGRWGCGWKASALLRVDGARRSVSRSVVESLGRRAVSRCAVESSGRWVVRSFSREGVGDGDVDGLGVDRADEFVQAAQAGEQIRLAAEGGRIEQQRGERTEAGGFAQEPAEGGEQDAFIREVLRSEGSDQPEDVVDAEVVGEAFVGDGVGDEGVAGGADAGQPGFEFRAVGVAEVVALVVAVAATDGPARPGRGAPGCSAGGLRGRCLRARRWRGPGGRRSRGSAGTTRRLPPGWKPAGGRGEPGDRLGEP